MLNRLSTARVACYFRPLSAPTNEDLAEGEKVTELGAAANVTLAAGKVGIGVFGNSAALVADGIHSLGDLLSDGVTYFCLQRSHLPSSERHPYGHGRVDSLGALGVAALLGATSASVGVSAITDLYAAYQGTVESVPSVWCAVAAGVSVGIKEYLFQQTKRVAARTRSQALMANAWHHRSDAYSSVAALLGAGGAMFLGVPMLDSAGALVVSGMLMKTAYETGARAALELVDADVNPVLRKQVEELLVETRSHVGHVGHHDLRVRASGPFNFVDVHVEVPPRISVSEAHWIADTVRLEVMSKFEEVRECLVHVDVPCCVLPPFAPSPYPFRRGRFRSRKKSRKNNRSAAVVTAGSSQHSARMLERDRTEIRARVGRGGHARIAPGRQCRGSTEAAVWR
ncbi:MAG: hypothetical protein MHM6MM_006691 [Cercozoa sp. M6MM]